jgi:hypothetical protein
MYKRRVLTGMFSAVFLLTLASSARADVVRADMFLETLMSSEGRNLTVFDTKTAETGYLFAAHENTSGKSNGFSIAAIHQGPRLGIVKPLSPSVSQNPEPTAMVLLGTGLAGVAALARKRSRRRRQ